MLFHICLYMHIGEPNSCHAHTCIYLIRNFHVIYLHLKGNSTSYIHLGSIVVPFLTWVNFLKGSLCYLSTNIHILRGILRYLSYISRFLKCIYLLCIHTLQGIFMSYIHTLCKAFPCYIYSHIYIPFKGIFHAT